MKTAIFSILSTIVLCSCGRKVNVSIDNPTLQKIEIKIDDKSYLIDTMETRTVYMKEGNHTIKYKDTTIIYTTPAFESDSNQPGIFINPTRSAYILEDKIYANTGLKPLETSYVIPLDTVRIMGVFTTRGHYKKIRDFILVKNWTYEIHEELPKEVHIRAFVGEENVLKLYREKEFLESLMKETLKITFQCRLDGFPVILKAAGVI